MEYKSMNFKTPEEIEKLRQDLIKATNAVIESYYKPSNPELTEAYGLLWDCCQEFMVAYEVFSKH